MEADGHVRTPTRAATARLRLVESGPASTPPEPPAPSSPPADLRQVTVRDLATVIVSLTEDSSPAESLVVPLGLNVWMRHHGAGLPELTEALRAVRAAIIDSSGLDPATEPVLLPLADPRVMALSLVAYIGDLVSRAAVAAGVTRRDVVQAALPLIDG